MKPAISLKLGAVAFAVLWTGGMLWSSGSIDIVNFVILGLCSALAGAAWCPAMRRVFQFIQLPRVTVIHQFRHQHVNAEVAPGAPWRPPYYLSRP